MGYLENSFLAFQGEHLRGEFLLGSALYWLGFVFSWLGFVLARLGVFLALVFISFVCPP